MPSNSTAQLAYVNHLDGLPECFGESLYNLVVLRIRSCKTLFLDNVKLSFRQDQSDHWAHLPLPHVLVVPTTSRGLTSTASEDLEDMVIARTVTLIAQFDGRASEHEWMAVNDIEAAEKQLLGCLLGWKPVAHYLPTLYSGMRVMGTKLPHVMVAYGFIFSERIEVGESEIGLEPQPEPVRAEKPYLIIGKPTVDSVCCVPLPEPLDEYSEGCA